MSNRALQTNSLATSNDDKRGRVKQLQLTQPSNTPAVFQTDEESDQPFHNHTPIVHAVEQHLEALPPCGVVLIVHYKQSNVRATKDCLSQRLVGMAAGLEAQ